uniref:Uncharacterized protein n=1 Tax=Tolypothrix bouteillei VB521301 TaxID=1479485 RepID=A0A0C1N3D9_9CYAN
MYWEYANLKKTSLRLKSRLYKRNLPTQVIFNKVHVGGESSPVGGETSAVGGETSAVGGETSAVGGFPAPWQLANKGGVSRALATGEQGRGVSPQPHFVGTPKPPVEATALGSPRCSRSVSAPEIAPVVSNSILRTFCQNGILPVYCHYILLMILSTDLLIATKIFS